MKRSCWKVVALVLVVGCVIFASAAVFDRFLQSSGVHFFHPSQVGWATAPVFITFDVAGTGGATWTMQPTSCIVNSYP